MDFKKAFDLVVGAEGGFTNDPVDNGNWTGGKRGVGELMGTKFGIAANTYGKALATQGKTIKDLTLDDARAIYKRDYWDKCQCDKLHDMLRYPLFSCAVNCGVKQASKFFQRAVFATDDGIIGAKTIGYSTHCTPSVILQRFYNSWEEYYDAIVAKNPAQARFLKGWKNRIAEVKKNNG